MCIRDSVSTTYRTRSRLGNKSRCCFSMQKRGKPKPKCPLGPQERVPAQRFARCRPNSDPVILTQGRVQAAGAPETAPRACCSHRPEAGHQGFERSGTGSTASKDFQGFRPHQESEKPFGGRWPHAWLREGSAVGRHTAPGGEVSSAELPSRSQAWGHLPPNGFSDSWWGRNP